MQALEEDRLAYKSQWTELGFDWDDDRMYPSNSDSSLTDSSEDEILPADTVKKASNHSLIADAPITPVWTVGTLCMAKYSADDKFYAAQVVKIEPDGVKVSFTDYDNELQLCAEDDLKPLTSARSARTGPVVFEQDYKDARLRDQPDSKLCLRALAVSMTTSGSASENMTCDELEHVPSSDRELAKTISHHINMLYRNVGKKESVLAALLRAAANEEHCDVLKNWLQPKPAVVNALPVQPITIDRDDNDNDGTASEEQVVKRASVPRNASKLARDSSQRKEVGWPDEDLKKCAADAAW